MEGGIGTNPRPKKWNKWKCQNKWPLPDPPARACMLLTRSRGLVTLNLWGYLFPPPPREPRTHPPLPSHWSSCWWVWKKSDKKATGTLVSSWRNTPRRRENQNPEEGEIFAKIRPHKFKSIASKITKIITQNRRHLLLGGLSPSLFCGRPSASLIFLTRQKKVSSMLVFNLAEVSKKGQFHWCARSLPSW